MQAERPPSALTQARWHAAVARITERWIRCQRRREARQLLLVRWQQRSAGKPLLEPDTLQHDVGNPCAEASERAGQVWVVTGKAQPVDEGVVVVGPSG